MSFTIISNNPSEALMQYQSWLRELMIKLKGSERGNLHLVKIALNYHENIKYLEKRIEAIEALKI